MPENTSLGVGRERVKQLALVVLLVGSVSVYGWRTRDPVVTRVDSRVESGEHTVLVFVAPTSVPGRDLAKAVEIVREALRAEVTAGKGVLSTVGVSDDWSLEDGLRILKAAGPFDEVIVGRNWLNTGIRSFVDIAGVRPAVPQLLVFREQVDTRSQPIVYGPRSEVVRLVGAAEIVEYADRISRSHNLQDSSGRK